jgi:hypothetical protein
MKYVFFTLTLAALLGAVAQPPRPPGAPRTWAALVSVDSLQFVLVTRDFPDLGFDYPHPDSIPVYRDSTFSRWSREKTRAAQLLRALPPIAGARPGFEPRGRDWERDFKKVVFVFPRSVFSIQALDAQGHVATPRGIYLLRDTLPFQRLRQGLDRRADHKEQFDTALSRTDRSQIHQAHNRRLLRRTAIGVAKGGALVPVWKTSWFVLH